jgi:hypothetical protein
MNTSDSRANGLAASMIVQPAPAKPEQENENPADGARYMVVDGRICAKTNIGQKGDPLYAYLSLCNFDAHIVADVEQDDGEAVDRCVAIVGKLDNGRPLPEITIKASEFESMGWVLSNWGGRVSIEPGRGSKDKLRHAIQTLSMDSMEYRRVYTHTGWRLLDGKRVFLHAGGAVGNADVRVELPHNLANYRLPHDQRVTALDAMRESIKLLDIAPTRVSAPLWAAMYLGPISEIITPSFLLWVEGQSGSLKSSLSAVMLNHFGEQFNEYALPADWLGTANSLEKLSFHAKDTPFFIDDFRPATSRAENKTMQDGAARIIRAAGNRQGRSRLDSDSQFKRTYAPRGVVISTAERGALGLSVNSRLLTVDIEPGDVDPAKLAIAQAQRHVYGYAMVGFIRYLAEHWDAVTTRLKENVAETRTAYSVSGQHKRLPNAIATLFAAFDLAMDYAQQIGAITKEEAEQRTTACFTALQEIAETQSAIVEAQDPTLRFVTAIVTLLAQGKVFIPGKDGAVDIGGELGERLGWWDGENIYLLPAAYNVVCRYVAQEGETFPLDSATLAKELDRRGYLAERGKGQIQLGRRDPTQGGKLTRVYILNHNRFMDIAESLGLTEADLYITKPQNDIYTKH